MKHLVFILAILITWTNLFCQTPKEIVSKDSKIQDKPNVTISGFDYGHHKTTEIIKDRQLKLNNNKDSLKIVSFNASFIKNGKLIEFKCVSDSLSQEVVDSMLTLTASISPNFHIDNIKAINNKKDTVILHPIVFKITN